MAKLLQIRIVYFSVVDEETKATAREFSPVWTSAELRQTGSDKWDEAALTRGDPEALWYCRKRLEFVSHL